MTSPVGGSPRLTAACAVDAIAFNETAETIEITQRWMRIGHSIGDYKLRQA
jgi:hypothetical protein